MKALTPYFAPTEPKPMMFGSGPDLMFVDFLQRLEGPAKVDIDPRQEQLILILRDRCAKYALSRKADDIAGTVNQLCALYHTAALRAGKTAFDVFHAWVEDYVPVQEPIHAAREQARASGQRPVEQTDNLLLYSLQLVENLLRKVATLGAFSIDVLSGNSRAKHLTALQYLDLPLKEKERRFDGHPSILGRTYVQLFGSLRHPMRNSIAHQRYVIADDGAVQMYDFDPRTKQRIDLGSRTQAQIDAWTRELEAAVDTFEISLFVFQHNHGAILYELGYYGGKKEYSDKAIVEELYREAPAAYLQIRGVTFEGEAISVEVQTDFPVGSDLPSEGIVKSSHKGKSIAYSLPIPALGLSGRNQTLRLMQKAAQFCDRYRHLTIKTTDESGELLGEVSMSMELLKRSITEAMSIEEFLSQASRHTFAGP